MKEIIFWFSNNQRRMYWLTYAFNNINKYTFGYNPKMINGQKAISVFGKLNIYFKTESETSKGFRGNEYWVEELFDNDFEEFFYSIVKDELFYEEQD